jgi:hypothetical protein
MAGINILGVLLTGRNNSALKFQETITAHGCNIKTRIGLHNVSEGVCSTSGVILLEVLGTEEEVNSLEKAILSIEGAQVQKMIFPNV